MNRISTSLKWAVILLAGASPVLPAAPMPRNPDVRAESWVHIGDAGVHVKQVQTFQRTAAADLWKKVDTNADGRLSAEEKKSAESILLPLFTDRSTLKLNWQAVQPTTVTVALDVLPQRRAKKATKRPSLAATFLASYPASASKADVVELSIPDLDAHEGAVHFTWDDGYIPLRASMGQMGKGNAWDMNQVDGVPPSFSLVVHRQPSGVDSIPNP